MHIIPCSCIDVYKLKEYTNKHKSEILNKILKHCLCDPDSMDAKIYVTQPLEDQINDQRNYSTDEKKWLDKLFLQFSMYIPKRN